MYEPIMMAQTYNHVNGSLRQKDHEFKASLGCPETLPQQIKGGAM